MLLCNESLFHSHTSAPWQSYTCVITLDCGLDNTITGQLDSHGEGMAKLHQDIRTKGWWDFFSLPQEQLIFFHRPRNNWYLSGQPEIITLTYLLITDTKNILLLRIYWIVFYGMLLRRSQHWFGWWLAMNYQQPTAQTNDDPVLWWIYSSPDITEMVSLHSCAPFHRVLWAHNPNIIKIHLALT